MSLFNRAIRPPPTVSDEAIKRYLAAIHADLDPDPLFRRRLRSDVVNRFVAAREGIADPAGTFARAGQMGRIGRACLYASFTLGLSAASVMAASQEALPGDPLYGLKLRVEELRMDVGPSYLRGELAGYALGERIEEMARLTELGRWELALAMAPSIDAEYDRLVALGNEVNPDRAARIERHIFVLQGLIDRLPANARHAVDNAVAPPRGADANRGQNAGNAGGESPARGSSTGGAPVDPTAMPERTPRPEPTPRPSRSPKPVPTAEPEAAPSADAGSSAQSLEGDSSN